MSYHTKASSSSSSSFQLVIASFVSGAITTYVVQYIVDTFVSYRRTKQSVDEDRTNAGATIEGNDLSLFYGNNINSLTTITPERKFLPKELYRAMVLDSVICCVDILAVRYNTITQQKECLLVERGSEPVKGVWWLPGGRLLKGETFFAAATRKAQEETGLMNVTPVQVLGVWNTFFPTSNWDTDTKQGTQTVNPIVLVELNDVNANVTLDATSENYRWISLDPIAATQAGEDRYVLQALLRLQAWDANYRHK